MRSKWKDFIFLCGIGGSRSSEMPVFPERLFVIV